MQERPFDCWNGLRVPGAQNPNYRKARYINAISATVETAIMSMILRLAARSFSDLCSRENFCLIDIFE